MRRDSFAHRLLVVIPILLSANSKSVAWTVAAQLEELDVGNQRSTVGLPVNPPQNRTASDDLPPPSPAAVAFALPVNNSSATSSPTPAISSAAIFNVSPNHSTSTPRATVAPDVAATSSAPTSTTASISSTTPLHETTIAPPHHRQAGLASPRSSELDLRPPSTQSSAKPRESPPKPQTPKPHHPKAKFKCSKPADCRNGGHCINETCFCSPGFTGESCDMDIDECRQFGGAGPPCQNNGTCVDDINGFHCDCQPGFRGERCQELADMCSPESPCLNGAQCINHRTSFTCVCEPGWEGQRCEINIDECGTPRGSPCQNNATCRDRINAFECDCLPGFTGPTCETNIDDCAAGPCRNNATCRDLIDDYECQCPVGFAGKNCEENIDDCAGKPCAHGECVDLVGDFECKCATGWRGKQCELDVNECEGAGRGAPPVCSNGATCQNLQPGYLCHCREGFGGRKCADITDYCKARQPCGKQGTCKNSNSTKSHHFQCECQSGYIGSRCEKRRDCRNECHDRHAFCVNNATCACLPGRRDERTMCEFVSSCRQVEGELCLNGGQCKDLESGGGYQCTCLEPFYGPICQFIAEKPQFDVYLIAVITGVGLVVVACIVVGLVLFRRVRKARATRGTYSPSSQEKHGNSANDLLKQPVPERLI